MTQMMKVIQMKIRQKTKINEQFVNSNVNCNVFKNKFDIFNIKNAM
jgi:hypothetical protein